MRSGADETVEVITSADLAAECELLLGAIVAEGGSRDAAVVHAPGGPENPDTSVRGHLRYLRQLSRMHAVMVGHGDTPRQQSHDEVDAVLTAALTDEPIAVDCSDGETRYVRPKSLHALAWLASLDRQVQENAKAATACAELADAKELEVYALAPLNMSLAVRLWAWIICAPGAQLPFDENATKVDPPKWTKRLLPEDMLKLFEAHLEVNQRRLSIISRAFPSESSPSQSRLPLSGFVGAMAAENGQDAKLLMRNHSLGKLFAQSVSQAEAHREARKRAEAA